MVIACFLILMLGWALCINVRAIDSPFVLGSYFVALSQFFPILQAVAGLVGLGVAGSMGLLRDLGESGPVPHIESPLGGFVVALITGGILVVTSLACGLVIRRITPKYWWLKSDEIEETNHACGKTFSS